MRVTFLAHSGFLIELDNVLLLFDWWKGELPPLSAKPLLVFASHAHPDHFGPHIFSLDDGRRTVRFLLGKDIRPTPKRCDRWGLTDTTLAKCQRLGGFHQAEPLPGVTVETFPSTDQGVAFLVSAEGRQIYHAGDLNWWHWEGEPDPWNPHMEVRYKEYTAPLKGRHLDLAMVPLDSRLGPAEDWGLRHLLEISDISHVLPMHQWGDFSPTGRFLKNHPQWAETILPVRADGQVFQLD